MLMWQNWRFWQKEFMIMFFFSQEVAGKAIPKPRQVVSWKKKALFPGRAPQLVIK